MFRDRRRPTVDAKIAGSRRARFNLPDFDPTAMSLPDRRVAADGTAYTYTDFVQWYGAHARRMWEGAAATEHSHNSTLQSSDVLPELRIAADGTAYTYTDFVNWYGMHADQLWERAAATEHNESSSIAADAFPLTRRSTWAEMLETSSGSNDTRMAVQSYCVGDRTQDATEHSPSSTTASAQVTGRLLQCIMCQRPLCGTEDLAFFWRANKQGGVEVHLMLKPEIEEPATFIRSPVTEQGALASWQCTCGFKLGDTRAVAIKKAPMTAFKSSSVMLCGQRFTGRKSQWPSIYNKPPFNAIEVRTRETFFGTAETSFIQQSLLEDFYAATLPCYRAGHKLQQRDAEA